MSLLLEIGSSSAFYYVCITVMAGIFAYYGYRILWQYRDAKTDAQNIANKLAELRNIPDTPTRIEQFNEWFHQNTTGSAYISKYFKSSWEYFYHKHHHLQRGGLALVPDVYDFFLEDSFIQKYGRRKFVEVIPGIFLALGIMGTFAGIAAGIGGMDPQGDAEALKASVAVLLAGMKGKFLSSICGIAFSLLWQWLDRNVFYPQLTEGFSIIRQELDHTFPTHEDNAILFQLLQNQEKHNKDNQAFMADVLLPKMVSQFKDALGETLLPPIEQAYERMTTAQMQGMNDMIELFVEKLNQAAGNQMKAFGETLRHTIEWHERVHSDLYLLLEALKQSTEHQISMSTQTGHLAGQMEGFTQAISLQQAALRENAEQLASSSRNLKEDLTSLFTSIEDERKAQQEYTRLQQEYTQAQTHEFQNNMDALLSVTNSQLKIQQQYENMNTQLSRMQDVQQSLSSALSGQAEKTQEASRNLEQSIQLLQSHTQTLAGLPSQFGQLLDTVSNERIKLNDMSQQMMESIGQQMEQMTIRAQRIEELWGDSNSASSELYMAMSQAATSIQHGHKTQEEEFERMLTALQGGTASFAGSLAELQETVTKFNDYVQTAKNSTQQQIE